VKYEYKMINVSLEPEITVTGMKRRATIVSAANRWAAMGWRTVSAYPARGGSGYADWILIEREKIDE